MKSGDHQPFLAEITARPADEAPRLVYADWLQERGDPRGEFIRIQCELANTPPAAKVRSDLTKRQTQLLKAHRAQWTIEAREAGVRNCEFVRGFVEQARTTIKDFVTRHEEICSRIPLRSLSLTGKVGGDLLPGCASLKQLHTLVLTKNDLRPQDLSEFVRSPFVANIEHWTCKYSQFPPEVTRSLAESTSLARLRTLHLSHAELNDSRLAPLVTSPQFTRLEEANFSYNGHHGTCWTNSPWRALRRLNVSYGGWESAGAEAFAQSPAFEGLEVLEMSGNYDLHEGTLAITRSQRATHLRAWGLRSCDLEGEAVEAILTSPHLTSLTSLDLAGNLLTDNDLQPLIESPRLQQFDKLLLSHNRLTRVGVDALVGSPHFNRRTRLYLRGNSLTRDQMSSYREEHGNSFGHFGFR